MFVISPITAEQVAMIEHKLAAAGTQVTCDPAKPNNYALHNAEHGISADAIFDPAANTLTVNVVKKPWLIPESAIKSGIEKALVS